MNRQEPIVIQIVDMFVRLAMPLDQFHGAVEQLCQDGLISRENIVANPWSGMHSVMVGKVYLVGCATELVAEYALAPVVVTVRGLSELVLALDGSNSRSVQGPEAFDGGWSLRVQHLEGHRVEYVEFASPAVPGR